MNIIKVTFSDIVVQYILFTAENRFSKLLSLFFKHKRYQRLIIIIIIIIIRVKGFNYPRKV